MVDMKKAAIILAAGQGKRMKSDLPKVLHEIDGKPMVEYVIDSSRNAGFDKIVVVVGHKHEMVIEKLNDLDIGFAVQYEQLGTGHAVKCAQAHFQDFEGIVLVLAGDMPLISTATIEKLVGFHKKTEAVATVLSVNLPDPAGYGRIVRDENGNFINITEHREADAKTLKVNEVNTGVICFNAGELFEVLDKISCNNDQGEYYLTDAIGIFSKVGKKVAAIVAEDHREGMGINSIQQLKEVEKILVSE
ncbi:MAG: NTP transferase domain-containing protein [candidate division Zixibacteria bacterium]|nr:NTP transferase domain-containing protein [candidate division Zixibacteria bacterium]